MPASPTKSARHDPVKQFSVFTENKVGRLSEVVNLLATHQIHVMALTTMDTTDSAIIRLVVDDPEGAANHLHEQGFAFTESDLLVVELDTEGDLARILGALLGAEINIHYIYPFIFRPMERTALAMNLEDIDLAAQALHDVGFRVLSQGDISR